MQLELYIHGNPTGFKYLGPINEKDSFFERFYNRLKNVNKELVIESLQPYYYYTYLLSKNVYDFNGRPNSYFGITVRFDAYYSKAVNIYTLLDTLCNKWVIGNLLKKRNDILQYTSGDLKQDVFNCIQTDLVDWIRRAIDDAELNKLKTASPSNKQVTRLNLVDCISENVGKNLQNNGSLSISSDYSLLREQEHETRLKALEEQWSKKVEDLNSKFNASEKKVQEFDGTIKSLQNQLSQAKNDLQNTENELNNYKLKTNLSNDIISGLKKEKEALLKLANFVDSLGLEDLTIKKGTNEDENHTHSIFKKSAIYIFAACALAFVVFFIFFCQDISHKGFPSFGNSNNTSLNKVAQQPANNLLPSSSDEPSTLEVEDEGGMEELSEQNEQNSINISNLRIDIGEFRKQDQSMEVNNTYTISVNDKAKNQPAQGVQGSWNIQGSGTIDDINDPSSVITSITPKKSGNIEIRFFINGNDTPIRRVVSVKQSN